MGKKLSVAVDFPDNLRNTAYDSGYLEKLFELFKKWGYERIYWIYLLKHSEKRWQFTPFSNIAKNLSITYKKIGELLPAVVKAARKNGLEIFAIYKINDLASPGIVPFGTLEASKYGRLDAIGGRIIGAAEGLVARQAMRSERRMNDIPFDIEEKRIGEIKLVSDTSEPTRIKKGNLQLWVSNDNKEYSTYSGELTFTEKVEGTNRVIILSDLDIYYKYLLITTSFRNGKGTFSNKLSNLIEIYDHQGKRLPFTYGLIPLRQYFGDLKKGSSYAFNMNKGRNIQFDGFLEDTDYSVDNESGFIALAKGKERYITGMLSPMYEEVQEYWLTHIKECLDAGVDGIDIRHSTHSCSFEWENYGFESPVVKEYKNRYGIDILKKPFDNEKRLQILAEYYTAFLRKASALIRNRGKKVQIHIGDGLYPRGGNPKLLGKAIHWGRRWEWKKWIEESLMDEITLKNIWPDESFLVDIVYEVSSKQNIPLHTCPWLSRIPQDKAWLTKFRNSLQRGKASGKIDGYILYEAASMVKETEDGAFKLCAPEVLESIKKFVSD